MMRAAAILTPITSLSSIAIVIPGRQAPGRKSVLAEEHSARHRRDVEHRTQSPGLRATQFCQVRVAGRRWTGGSQNSGVELTLDWTTGDLSRRRRDRAAVSTRGWPPRESWRGGHRRSRAHQLVAASSSIAADGRQHRCNRGRRRRPREAGKGCPGDREGRWPAGICDGSSRGKGRRWRRDGRAGMDPRN
jgi:hypothetical protein